MMSEGRSWWDRLVVGAGLGIAVFSAVSIGSMRAEGAAGAGPAASLSPAAQARYRAATERGCSEQWASIEAAAADMAPAIGKAWLTYRSERRLHELAESVSRRLGQAVELERVARQGLAEWKCGAAREDDVALASLMSTLGAALQSQGRGPEAERARRETLDFVERRLPARQDLIADALTALAASLEARADYAEAQALRQRAMEISGHSLGKETHSLARGETDIDLLMSLTRVDEASNVGQYAAAESAARYSLDEADKRSVPDDYVTAAILLKLAGVLDGERKFAAAEPLLHRLAGIRNLPAAHLDEVMWAARKEQIRNLMGQARFQETESLATLQLADADRSGNAEHRIAANQQLGELYVAQKKGRQAEPYLRAAMGIGRSSGISEDWYGILAYTLSAALRYQGRYGEAESLLRPVIARDRERAGIVDGKLPAEIFGDKAHAVYSWGGSGAAFTDYALDLTAMAAALEGLGRNDEARRLAEQSLDINTRQLQLENTFDPEVHTAEIRSSRDSAARYLVPALAEIDARRQNGSSKARDGMLLDEAFETGQYITNGAAGAALVKAGVKAMAERMGLSSDITSRDELESRLTQLESQDLSASAEAGPAAFEAHLQAKKKADEVVGALRANAKKLKEKLPDYWNLIDPGPVSIAELQGASHLQAPLLRPDEALILVLQEASGVYVYAVSLMDAAWHKAAITTEELNASVSRLRCTLDRDRCVSGASAGPFDRATAFRLYTALFGDRAIARIVDAESRILFSSNGALTSLPLGVLVTERPAGSDADPRALRDTHWLMRDKAISVLPSVASLRTLRRAMTAGAAAIREPFLGFAPQFQGQAHDGRGVPGASRSYFADERALVERIRELPDLATDREIDAVRVSLGASADAAFKGERARKVHVLELDKSGRLGRARVIEFATHALTSGDFALGEPALVLSPPPVTTAEYSPADNGLLTASEVAGLHLDADWVILSACNTGAGETPEAEGLSGLARAFMFAGAKSLLVSHWSVDDEAALFLVTRSVAIQQNNAQLSRAEALKMAELELLNDQSGDRYSEPTANPAIWAPFVVIGAE